MEIIRLTHLSESKKKDYALVHNKFTMNTRFDYNILDCKLAFINGTDMKVFGFKIGIDDDDFNTDFLLSDE